MESVCPTFSSFNMGSKCCFNNTLKALVFMSIPLIDDVNHSELLKKHLRNFLLHWKTERNKTNRLKDTGFHFGEELRAFLESHSHNWLDESSQFAASDLDILLKPIIMSLPRKLHNWNKIFPRKFSIFALDLFLCEFLVKVSVRATYSTIVFQNLFSAWNNKTQHSIDFLIRNDFFIINFGIH